MKVRLGSAIISMPGQGDYIGLPSVIRFRGASTSPKTIRLLRRPVFVSRRIPFGQALWSSPENKKPGWRRDGFWACGLYWSRTSDLVRVKHAL